MRIKLKNILILLPILIGISLFFGINFSNAACSSEEISQLLNESENCNTINCLISLSSRLETCKAGAQEEKEEATAKTENFQQKVNELGNSISQKNANIDSLNAQISDLQYKISKLNKEISETEKKMRANKKRMHGAIKNFYEYDKKNFVTMMLSETDISDFFDEVFYVGKIEGEISSIVKELKEDKKSLKNKKEELSTNKQLIEESRSKLASEKNVLTQEKSEQDKLLSSAQSNEANHASMLEKIKREKATVNSALSRLFEQLARNSKNISTGGTGGYPFPCDDQGDPWNFLRCQCTSYAAWRWNTWGYYWTNPPDICGDARCWPKIARRLGYPISSSPCVRGIASWSNGLYGHVAIVEKVFPNGWIRISDYNAVPPYGESFSRRDIDPSSYAGATFICPK